MRRLSLLTNAKQVRLVQGRRKAYVNEECRFSLHGGILYAFLFPLPYNFAWQATIARDVFLTYTVVCVTNIHNRDS